MKAHQSRFCIGALAVLLAGAATLLAATFGGEMSGLASAQKAAAESMLTTSHLKFWPKNPTRKESGRKIVATTVSCLVISLSRLETVER